MAAARRSARPHVGVRGRSARGGGWGEAAIGEFEETSGSWDAVRWALSGLLATRRTVPLPRGARVRRRLVVAVVAVAAIGVPVNAYAAGVAVTIGPGQIYVLGDNRQDSRDSRQLGTFAASAVTGRVLVRMGRP